MVKVGPFEFKRAEKEKEPFGIPLPVEAQGNFEDYMEQRKKETGKTEVQILNDMFGHNGWMTAFIEETKSSGVIDASQMFGMKTTEKKDPIDDYIRLRHEFAPVSACVDYVKQQILGGGIDVLIDDAKNKHQKEFREYLIKFIDNLYQDEYTRNLNILLSILLDEALTTGVGVAEIAYLKNIGFWDYAKLKNPTMVKDEKGKNIEVVEFDISDPKWEDLKGIKRLKIIDDAYKRFTPHRDEKSWEVDYWAVDEKQEDLIKAQGGSSLRKFDKKNPKGGIYFHTWQVFWLTVNRTNFGLKGESIIKPAASISLILEKIMGAVGEGMYRAGHKKYFVIMGTEKRPWGGPFIRNVLKQMQEAKKKNWSTIPMPMGFDIKEMGGEVFDAKEVVDYFLKTIAKTMNVPAKTLGVEVREEESYTYQLFKMSIAEAIKHQLFKHHIWCKFGTKSTKQGGAEEAVTIPTLRFKVEDLLPYKERIKTLFDTFNLANPLHPLTKLKTEREYCKAMGWYDVLYKLPTLDEMEKELEEAKQAQEKALNEPKKGNPLEKRQGPPEPPTEEKLKKRQEAGVSIRKVDSAKGKAQPLGPTRIPKENK